MYSTSKEGHEYDMQLNKHKCKTCGLMFINFVGMADHLNDTGHNKYNLIKNG